MRLLLKGMQYVNGLLELGDIDDPEFATLMDSDFSYSRADRGHRPPVVRVQATLYLAELIASRPAGRLRKGTQIVQHGTNEFQRFHIPNIRNYV